MLGNGPHAKASGGEFAGGGDQEVQPLFQIAEVFVDHVPGSRELMQCLQAVYCVDMAVKWRVHCACFFVL